MSNQRWCRSGNESLVTLHAGLRPAVFEPDTAPRVFRFKYHESPDLEGCYQPRVEGFLYLVEAGADLVKIGIGGGSICITREQKGIGPGQATALIELAKAGNEFFDKRGAPRSRRRRCCLSSEIAAGLLRLSSSTKD